MSHLGENAEERGMCHLCRAVGTMTNAEESNGSSYGSEGESREEDVDIRELVDREDVDRQWAFARKEDVDAERGMCHLC